MVKLLVGQHLYGNVEKDESPLKIGGFQTLFYSHNFLTEKESDELEKRLVYYFSKDRPLKRIFFKLGEKYVMTQVTPSTEVDKFGRKGVYFAHSLIFLEKEFELLHYNPLIVFHLFQDIFLKNFHESLTLKKTENSNISPINFELEEKEIDKLDLEMGKYITHWNPEELKKLVFLGINGQRLKNEGKSLFISGDQNEICNTLKVILSLIPNPFRRFCSFDTHFLGCNPIKSQFWMYGYPESPDIASSSILVDVAAKRISNVMIDTSSPYEKWIFTSISQKKYIEINNFRNVAYEMDQFLSGEEFDKNKIGNSLNSPDLDLFLSINRSSLEGKLRNYLGTIIFEDFAELLSKIIRNEYDATSNKELLEKLIIGFDPDEISRYLLDELRIHKEPSKKEIQGLNEYLIKNKHLLLNILYLKWIKKYDAIQKNLEILEESDYRTAISFLIGDLDITYIILKSRMSSFIEVFSSTYEKNKDLRGSVLSLINYCFIFDRKELLSKIILFLPDLDKKQLIEIQNFINGRTEEEKRNIPEDFQKSLISCITVSEQKSGIFSKFVDNISFMQRNRR